MPKKSTPDDWIAAKTLFELGKSLSEINAATGLDKSLISKRSKKDGWEKGKNQQLVADAARVRVELSNFESTARAVVDKEIDKRTRHIDFLNNLTLKNLSIMAKKIDSDMDINEHRLAQEAINKGADQLLGKDPNTVINNTNAQQNNEQITKIEWINP